MIIAEHDFEFLFARITLTMTTSQSVFDRLTTLLESHDVEFNVLEHEPVFTSEEAAAVRGTALSSGAKALICKVDKQFAMFVVPADRRLANKQIRATLKSRRLRFASRDEVLEMTTLKPGSIPPFGSVFGLTTYCDERIANESVINFNAGDHARSISMSYADYLRTEQPICGVFAE